MPRQSNNEPLSVTNEYGMILGFFETRGKFLKDLSEGKEFIISAETDAHGVISRYIIKEVSDGSTSAD